MKIDLNKKDSASDNKVHWLNRIGQQLSGIDLERLAGLLFTMLITTAMAHLAILSLLSLKYGDQYSMKDEWGDPINCEQMVSDINQSSYDQIAFMSFQPKPFAVKLNSVFELEQIKGKPFTQCRDEIEADTLRYCADVYNNVVRPDYQRAVNHHELLSACNTTWREMVKNETYLSRPFDINDEPGRALVKIGHKWVGMDQVSISMVEEVVELNRPKGYLICMNYDDNRSCRMHFNEHDANRVFNKLTSLLKRSYEQNVIQESVNER